MARETSKTRGEMIEELHTLKESIARDEEREEIFKLFNWPDDGHRGAEQSSVPESPACSSCSCGNEPDSSSHVQSGNGSESRLVQAMSRLAGLSSLTPMDEVFMMVAKEARELLDAESALVSVCDPLDGTFVYKAVAGSKAMVCLGERMSLGDATVSGWILRQNNYFCSENIPSDMRVDRERRELLGIKTAIGAPLLQGNEVHGAVALINRTDGGRYTRKEARDILIPFSLFAGAILEKASCAQYSESLLDSTPFPIFELGRDQEVLRMNRAALKTFDGDSVGTVPGNLATSQWEAGYRAAMERSRTSRTTLPIGADSDEIESVFVPFSWNREGNVRSVMAFLVGLADSPT